MLTSTSPDKDSTIRNRSTKFVLVELAMDRSVRRTDDASVASPMETSTSSVQKVVGIRYVVARPEFVDDFDSLRISLLSFSLEERVVFALTRWSTEKCGENNVIIHLTNRCRKMKMLLKKSKTLVRRTIDRQLVRIAFLKLKTNDSFVQPSRVSSYLEHGIEQAFSITRALFTFMNVEIQHAQRRSFMNLTVRIVNVQMFFSHFQQTDNTPGTRTWRSISRPNSSSMFPCL